VTQPASSQGLTGCRRKLDGGDEMTAAMISNLREMTGAPNATVRMLQGPARQPRKLMHLAGPAADGWRVVEVWVSPEVMGTCFPSATSLVADAYDGEPTWEDAEWQ
jgi:hypothetical protein